MVTIKKGKMVKNVTSSAFANFYKNTGWTAVTGSPSNNSKVEEEEDWDSVIEEEKALEKPLEDMTRKELEAKAKELGIDLTGLGKTAQIREAIRVYLG